MQCFGWIARIDTLLKHGFPQLFHSYTIQTHLVCQVDTAQEDLRLGLKQDAMSRSMGNSSQHFLVNPATYSWSLYFLNQ